MRKLIILIMAAIIISSAAAETQTVYVICNPDSFVWAREYPKFGANEIAYLQAGDEIQTDGRKDGGWLHVISDLTEPGEGWIYAGYISYSEPEVFQSGVQAQTTRGKVRARRYAGGKIRKTLKKGVTVTAYVVADDWTVTDAGFIKTEFLEFGEEEVKIAEGRSDQ